MGAGAGAAPPRTILLTGATGFICSRLREALLARGDRLVCVGRRPGPLHPRCRWVAADLAADPPPDWPRLLRGVDAVVNAAGIFREHRPGMLDALHHRGPVALFDACIDAGVLRVLQVSALGAGPQALTGFHRSKHAADAHLLALPLDATVVQPSLVFGAEGDSARGFMALAALPLLPLPAGGRQALQPVHLDDVVAALLALLDAPPWRWAGRRLALVGPAPMALGAYLQALRQGLGLKRAPTLALPAPLMRLAARAGDRRPDALFDSAAWQMLQQGNAASAADIVRLLDMPPRPVQRFIPPALADALRAEARQAWTVPLARGALALVWLVTAWVSWAVFAPADSHALLARAGVPAAWQPAALAGAVALDALLGVLTLCPLRPAALRRLWAAQALLMAGYSAVIAWRLPEFWAHPYGPMTKNAPMLALLAWLWAVTPAAPGRRAGGPADGSAARPAGR